MLKTTHAQREGVYTLRYSCTLSSCSFNTNSRQRPSSSNPEHPTNCPPDRSGSEGGEVSIHVVVLCPKRFLCADRDPSLGSPLPVLRGNVLNARPIVKNSVFWRLVADKWNLHEDGRFVTRKVGEMARSGTV